LAVRRLDEYLRRASRAIRSGEVDVDVFLKRLVEAIVDAVGSQPAGGCRVEEVVERLERIEERLAAIERRLQELQRGGGGGGRQGQQRGEPSWVEEVVEAVRGNGGYMMLSRLDYRFRSRVVANMALLERKGIVTIRLPGDYLLVERRVLRDFLEKAAGLDTSDEAEAEERLGPYGPLFKALRASGLMIFRAGYGWRPTGEVRRAASSQA